MMTMNHVLDANFSMVTKMTLMYRIIGADAPDAKTGGMRLLQLLVDHTERKFLLVTSAPPNCMSNK